MLLSTRSSAEVWWNSANTTILEATLQKLTDEAQLRTTGRFPRLRRDFGAVGLQNLDANVNGL
ncbi:MAG: hypothetical protein DRJ50_03005 [Actinobacteria bacterium]|nr:MAG: hypothetical protein DRJ50_03005 [Actinomycetota bacterium]